MPRRPAKVPCKENCGEFTRYNKITNLNKALCSGCERRQNAERVRVEKLKATKKRKNAEKRFKDSTKLLEIRAFEKETMKIEAAALENELQLAQSEEANRRNRDHLDSLYGKDMDI